MPKKITKKRLSKIKHKQKYTAYIRSKEWAEIRADLIFIHDHTCQICAKKAFRLQVHHLTYKNLFNEEPEDLLLLCSKCHMGIHGIGKSKTKPLSLNLPRCRRIIIKKFNLKNKCLKGWIGLATSLSECLNHRKIYGAKKKARSRVYVRKYVRENI